MEILALEYRQSHFASPQDLVNRLAEVADACAAAGLSAVGLAGLLSGEVGPVDPEQAPALLFGLRADNAEGVVAFGDALSLRGYTGFFTWTEHASEESRQIADSVWAGLGLIRARGGSQVLVDAPMATLRSALDAPRKAAIWMPAPDASERAVDGLFIEEAARRSLRLIWVPGTGINPFEAHEPASTPQILSARVDDGSVSSSRIARWARGDRIERSRARIEGASEVPMRWLREVRGWRNPAQ